jgi:hypothetical protein
VIDFKHDVIHLLAYLCTLDELSYALELTCKAQSYIFITRKMQQFALMVIHQEPTISDVTGFMDGFSFTLECTSERVTQNTFYCGYGCDTTVNNAFTGKVYFCALNYPGCWADGSLTA